MISLLDWKINVACTLVVLTGMYFFHTSEVKIAVNKAEMQLVQKYNKEISILKEKAQKESKDLQSKIEINQKEKDRAIQSADRKFVDFRQWLYQLPSKTSQSNLPGNTQDSEASSREVIAELSRENAEALGRYAYDAEELRVNLTTCYKDYDAVKTSLDSFRASP